MAIKLSNAAVAASRALREELVAQEVRRRQQMLDGIALEDRNAARQRQEQALQRQNMLDEEAAQDRQRQQRDAADKEARRIAEREADRQRDELRDKDAAANRYLDAELGRHEREAQRASNERVARIHGSGRRKDNDDTPTHDAAAVTLDALDELSGRINTAEGLAAKAAGSWKAAAASANYDDDVAEYNAVLTGAIPSIARKMGHQGVLTQPDVDSVKGMFPKPGDSKTLRERKMARIRSIMNTPAKGGGSGNGRGPAVGTRRTINGQAAEWDGEGWLPVGGGSR